MARSVRVEFPGAIYHVMARGDRRERIFFDKEDRRMFLRTLGSACERSGFRVHGYVLMSNHYHLLIETPEANLSVGMGWLQNAFTRRINVRHGLWGHLFGDRYKSILVEPGNGFWAVLDYIHLNPVRAGIVREEDGVESFAWSSLGWYLAEPERRPCWMATEMGFVVSGCRDQAKGRREFLEALESRVDWKSPTKAGEVLRDGDEGPKIATHCSLRRGWIFGSQEFKERVIELARKHLSDKAGRARDGYSGDEVREYGEREAARLIEAGLKFFELKAGDFGNLTKGEWRKAVIAHVVQKRTTVRLDWIADQLHMGSRGYCSRKIQTAPENEPARTEILRFEKFLEDDQNAIKYD